MHYAPECSICFSSNVGVSICRNGRPEFPITKKIVPDLSGQGGQFAPDYPGGADWSGMVALNHRSNQSA